MIELVATIITIILVVYAFKYFWWLILLIVIGLLTFIVALLDFPEMGGGIDVVVNTKKPREKVIETKTVKTIVKKEVVKPTFKDEMRRFEEEAFWISVFEDEEL